MMVNKRDDLPQLPPPENPLQAALKFVLAVAILPFAIVATVVFLVAIIGGWGFLMNYGLWVILGMVVFVSAIWQGPRLHKHIVTTSREGKLQDAQVEHLKAKTEVLRRSIAFDERGNAGLLLEDDRVIQLRGNHTELPAGVQNVHHHVVTHGGALPAKAPEVVDADKQVIPQAPPFRAMAHLISESRMPLCYTFQDGMSAPAFGTMDDLLSMAVTGKPGRGKTTALMYYVCMLLKCGAEVYVFDPHGAMADMAVLNNRPLPGMPRTSRILYVSRREDMVNLVPALMGKLAERDTAYQRCIRQHREYKNHPLLLLADELPVLANYDHQTAAEYKQVNKRRGQAGQLPLEVPLMIDLIRRFVLEARKWRCFFIGSGPSFDAEVLPARITESLNSRIVFFSSERRARMSGLESEAVKELLPVIRNAGPGVMIFDCARWSEPVIGALPAITSEDMRAFLGVQSGLPDLPLRASLDTDDLSLDESDEEISGQPYLRLVEPVPAVPDASDDGAPGDESRTSPGPITGQLRTQRDARFSPAQAKQFSQEYRKALLTRGTQRVDVKTVLRKMKLGNTYYRHARIIAEHVKRELPKSNENAAQS